VRLLKKKHGMKVKVNVLGNRPRDWVTDNVNERFRKRVPWGKDVYG